MKYNPTGENTYHLQPLNGAWKQNTFRNVKRDNGCRENTANGLVCYQVSNIAIWY